MDDGQVAVHTGQNVKEYLFVKNAAQEKITHCHQRWKIPVEPHKVKHGPQSPDEVHDRHVVGNDIRVARCFEGALLPPLLVAQVQDGDGEREEETESGEKEEPVDYQIIFEAFADTRYQMNGGVGGRRRVVRHCECVRGKQKT